MYFTARQLAPVCVAMWMFFVCSGQSLANADEAQTERARIELIGKTPAFTAGLDSRVQVLIENLDDSIWDSSRVFASYHWYSMKGDILVWEGLRSHLPLSMFPGQQQIVSVDVVAPDHPGKYILVLDLVEEGVEWFMPRKPRRDGIEIVVKTDYQPVIIRVLQLILVLWVVTTWLRGPGGGRRRKISGVPTEVFSKNAEKSDYWHVWSRRHVLLIVLAFVSQAILLIWSATMSQDRINPDAVSYIRVAQYLWSGDFELMLNGYWGPLLSWLIAPWLLVFDHPLQAAHAAMAVSALVFLMGSLVLFLAARLPVYAVIAGTWLIALLSVIWSVFVVTPDLLMAGILYFSIAMLLSDAWVASKGYAFLAGLFLGASYLAKSVALPVSILVLLVIGGMHVITRNASNTQLSKAIVSTVLGLVLVAGPWISVISHKYDRPVFSTSGPVAHAVAGPNDIDRYHPTFRYLHRPEAGRLSSWEDPTGQPYRYWSPLQSETYLKYQFELITRNVKSVQGRIASFDWHGLGLLALVLAFFFAKPWRDTMKHERWRWSLLPVCCVAAVYLPVFADDERYFWITVPFLIIASLGLFSQLLNVEQRRETTRSLLVVVFVAAAFVPYASKLYSYLRDNPYDHDYIAAREYAHKMKAAGLRGGIASIGTIEQAGYFGYYLSYHLDEPWLGLTAEPVDENVISSLDISYIVVHEGSGIDNQLSNDPDYSDLSNKLFTQDHSKRPGTVALFDVDP